MKKVEQIDLQYLTGDQEVKISFKANSKGEMPVFRTPKLEQIDSLRLFYQDESQVFLTDRDSISREIKELEEAGDIAVELEKMIVPVMRYSDITEESLLGGEPILQENLASKEAGLWAFSGKRKMKLSFYNRSDFESDTILVRIVFKSINEEIFDINDFSLDQIPLISEDAVFFIDTDQLGKIFMERYGNDRYRQFIGEVEVQVISAEEKELIYQYPICITIRNPELSVCDRISSLPASIDFGTSSTCVAIEGREGIELLQISAETKEEENPYENPTNLMLFHWKRFYQEWRKENENIPVLIKGDLRENQQYKNVDFDFGYRVKELLGEVNKRELNSILTLIKMIPYQILEEKQQFNLNPYVDQEQFIYLVTDPEEQDEKHFDPVAFYGYLIGRAINNISERPELFPRFQITCPVKFSQTIKKKMEKSLKYGLTRSVPKPLRNHVSVEMKFVEPLAYIGALCGTDYFRIEENEQKLFAVYDFGGGTLDFSYGTVLNEEEILKIEVLGVGGNERIGGEKLIERLSYKIYLKNKTDMIQKKIPIIRPFGEKLPTDLPHRLVNPSDYSRANTNKLNEIIARGFFEGKPIAESPVACELIDLEGNRVDVTMVYDETEMEEELLKLIQDTVETFAYEMDRAFEQLDGYHREQVFIFKAGNSSKSRFVGKAMEEIFGPKAKIQLVDQLSDGTEEYQRYAITPKTAVAFGQLKLNNILVTLKDLVFKYYVGSINQGTGEFKVCIDRNCKNTEWKKFWKVRTENTDLFYVEALPIRNQTIHKKIIASGEHLGKNIFLRIRDAVTLEYCFWEGETVEESSAAVTALVLE